MLPKYLYTTHRIFRHIYTKTFHPSRPFSSQSITMTTNRRTKPVVMWFRSDLRISDNPALHHASQYANTKDGVKIEPDKVQPVVGLYVVNPEEWKSHDMSPAKLDFTLLNLSVLKQTLHQIYGIPLIIRTTQPTTSRKEFIQASSEAVVEFAKEVNASALFANAQYELDESQRDELVSTLLEEDEEMDISFELFHDQCVVRPGELLAASSGKPYKVYTPFKNKWIALVKSQQDHYLTEFAPPIKQEFPNSLVHSIQSDPVPSSARKVRGFEQSIKVENIAERWPPGEEAAAKRLFSYAINHMNNYGEQRDKPASSNGTSSISPYLAIGALSSKQCINAAKSVNNGMLDSGKNGVIRWVQEIIWREFYRHILVAFPGICKGEALKEEMDIKWENNEEYFQRWCEGKTGYPFVDAGMRQLLQTGWMHNRLRMVVAMFLTKHLLVDWRWGEKWFNQHLVDADFASNNGGWQWASSTGTDAQPYFRIFHPVTQGQRFDEDGEYIKTYVPMLQSLPLSHLHEPWHGLTVKELKSIGYASPIVDHKEARTKVLEIYRVEKEKRLHSTEVESKTPRKKQCI